MAAKPRKPPGRDVGTGSCQPVIELGRYERHAEVVAPHLVRRHAPGTHCWLLAASAAMGAALLLVADVLARALIAPQELPVGVVTAVVGGVYLFALLRRRGLGPA